GHRFGARGEVADERDIALHDLRDDDRGWRRRRRDFGVLPCLGAITRSQRDERGENERERGSRRNTKRAPPGPPGTPLALVSMHLARTHRRNLPVGSIARGGQLSSIQTAGPGVVNETKVARSYNLRPIEAWCRRRIHCAAQWSRARRWESGRAHVASDALVPAQRCSASSSCWRARARPRSASTGSTIAWSTGRSPAACFPATNQACSPSSS